MLTAMNIRRATLVSAQLAGVLFGAMLAGHAAAQMVEVPDGRVMLKGGEWTHVASGKYATEFVKVPVRLDKRGETGGYALTVWKEETGFPSWGVKATLAAYGFNCAKNLIVLLSETDFNRSGERTPREGGSPPAIEREPKDNVERGLLAVGCGQGRLNSSRITDDPFNF